MSARSPNLPDWAIPVAALVGLIILGIGSYYAWAFYSQSGGRGAGPALAVNGSAGPINVTVGSVVTMAATGCAPSRTVQFVFNSAPVVVSGIFVAATVTATAAGSATATYTILPPGPPGSTFYIAAVDGSGNVSNWVAATITG